MLSHFLSVKHRPMMHGTVSADWIMKAFSQWPSLFSTDAKEKPRKMPSGLQIDRTVIQRDFSLSEP